MIVLELRKGTAIGFTFVCDELVKNDETCREDEFKERGLFK